MRDGHARLALTVAVLFALLVVPIAPTGGHERAAWFEVERVESVPDGAAVIDTDETRVLTVPELHSAVTPPYDNVGVGNVRQLAAIERWLDHVTRADGPSYYLRHDGVVVRITGAQLV